MAEDDHKDDIGYLRYAGNTVSIRWDPNADSDDWYVYHPANGLLFNAEFPEGTITACDPTEL